MFCPMLYPLLSPNKQLTGYGVPTLGYSRFQPIIMSTVLTAYTFTASD